MGRLRQFIVEYVGNLHDSDGTDPAPPAAAAERRTNRHARDLIDWIEGQMEARGFPAAKKHEFVTDLRRALRQGLLLPSGVSVSDVADEGRPDWVPETKGISRDASS